MWLHPPPLPPHFNSVYVRPSYTTRRTLSPLIRHTPITFPLWTPPNHIYWSVLVSNQRPSVSLPLAPFLVCDAWPLFSRNRPKFNPASILLTPSIVWYLYLVINNSNCTYNLTYSRVSEVFRKNKTGVCYHPSWKHHMITPDDNITSRWYYFNIGSKW